MFPFLAPCLTRIWGPFRLFQSHLALIACSAIFSAFMLILFYPRLWKYLPRDIGKAFVNKSEEAAGKPTGGGIIIVVFFLLSLLLFMPFSLCHWGTALGLFCCMMTGYLDDCSGSHWSELRKGLWDFVISLGVVLIMTHGKETSVWLPIIRSQAPGGVFTIPYPLYVLGSTCILWITINVVNCSDGVDGLAGSLSLSGLFGFGIFLYAIIGHKTSADYLLLPHYSDGASWAVMAFTAAGALGGYLWHNAHPSSVLMGDAGSRFIGLLLGICAIAAGNPLLVLAAVPMLFIDGGLGLVKLTLLRTLKKLGYDVRSPLSSVVNPRHPENFATDEEASRQLWIVRQLGRVRCPVHDHCRKNAGWSDTQVLVRFMLLQIILSSAIMMLMIKLR